MCGMVGIVNLNGNDNGQANKIYNMNESNAHRGPDGSGVWFSTCRRVSLGHRRLSIIDLSDNGSQPIKSSDSKFILTYNGEIYNFLELRAACEQLGSVFFSQSDSEVILECYRHWGAECFKKFRGMWALALVDLEKNCVVLSRDPFAIKPLYYGFLNGCLYFGSEPRNLHQASDYFKEEDLITSTLFLEHAYLERDDWTFYKHIKRFPHAHYSIISLEHSLHELQFRRYWSPSSEINYNISYAQATKKVKDLLHDSVKLHLRSDVPVGACLSGGIDSSAIVSIGSAQLAHSRFTTFTTHYPRHKQLDETSWAQKVIDCVKAKSYFVEPTKESFLSELHHLINAQGEPFGSMSIFAQYTVFKKISETGVKVVLDGQGADEMLAGYLGFLPFYFKDLISKQHYLTLLRDIFAFRFYGTMQFDVRSTLKKSLALISRKNKHVSLSQERSEFEDELGYRLEKLNRPHHSFESRLEHLLCESNIPQLLRYEDRNSMCFSIESRVPFLETELVNFILSLPADFRLRKGFTKAVLRDALKGVIPDEIRLRRDKLGFPAPELQWLKECFNIDAPTNGSKQWREFIYSKWSELNYSHKREEEVML